MKNIYHRDIMQLLLLKGREGMHVSQLSRMIYNLHTNLFERNLNYNQLHQTIRFYMWRQSHMRRSPIMRIKYGYYAIKPDVAIQLDIHFDEVTYDETETKTKKELLTPYNDPRQMKLFDL